jgi:hypothetical protein
MKKKNMRNKKENKAGQLPKAKPLCLTILAGILPSWLKPEL